MIQFPLVSDVITARTSLKAFKTSLVPINHKKHSHSCDVLYLLNLTELNNKMEIVF